VGLDARVGAGGCVVCKIIAEWDGGEQTLWSSGFVQGKDGPRDTGPLNIEGMKRAVLVTEFGHEGRPAGADPLDIRDEVVWLDPLVTLDLPGVPTTRRALAMLPGAADWSLTGEGWNKTELASRWNAPANQWDSILRLPQETSAVLQRKWTVTADSDVVELLTVCPQDLDEHDFHLLVNGEAVPWHNNADRNQIRQWTLRYSRARTRDGEQENNLSERLAYWWDLSPWRGQAVEVELALRGKNARNEIAWRELSVRSAVVDSAKASERGAPAVLLTSLEPLQAEGRARPVTAAMEKPDQPIRFLGQQWNSGYVLNRDSRVRFALQPEYARFTAIVGSCTQVAGPVQVLVDERVVWERGAISALSPAERIDLPIPAGAKQLTLQCGSDSLYYGYAAFAEAGFTRRENP
jgi:hypothetical protein